MKVRNGFVSNSSSSSFILDGNQVSPEQLDAIRNPAAWIEKAIDRSKIINDLDYGRQVEEFGCIDEPWHVDIHERVTPIIACYTSMDNFDMVAFVKFIGVPDSAFIGNWHSNEGGWR